MVKIKGKIKRSGNSYHILIRKALVDAEVLEEGKEYIFKLERSSQSTNGPKAYHSSLLGTEIRDFFAEFST